jgi:RNA polymerase sigma-70 factor (ECF subfamily)
MFNLSNGDSAREYTDVELLIRSQNQPWLFGVLIDRYQAAFQRKVSRILFDPRDVEEVVQDTFTKIYLNAHTFREQPDASFSSWAYRILLNTAFTRYQRLQRDGARVVVTDPEFMEFIAVEEKELVVNERRDAIERVLARLPQHFVAVLRLHYLDRYSHEDIARETGENVGTIKARIHRAKAAFRKESKAGEMDTVL